MTSDTSNPPARDLRAGVALNELADGGIVAGRVGDDDAIVVRSGESIFAVGALCPHYHGELAQGLVVDGTVRCPRHHACFDLRTGAALRAPAIDPIACWRIERVGDSVFVRERVEPSGTTVGGSVTSTPSSGGARSAPAHPSSVAIVGGGAAGLACADALRREGYAGAITIISADDSPPCDRPNLSKDFLMGTALDEWMPLRPPEYFEERKISLRLETTVQQIDTAKHELLLDGGERMSYGALLLATGAQAVQLDIPGAAPNQVFVLRSFADARAIAARAADAKRVLVVGASFIGLEAAASLRYRGVDVHVVAPGKVPMDKVLGADVGGYVQRLHESHGVKFHLGATVKHLDGSRVTLDDGTAIDDIDFIVTGVGARPLTALAERAGLATDRGVLVDSMLRASAPDIFVAGDIARWPDPHSGERIRVEHWNVAQRQGQVAALNMLGREQVFDAVPFFWSQHYELEIHYVGHAESWDSTEIDGSLDSGSWSVTYRRAGKVLAVATMGRTMEAMRVEVAMEQD